MAWFGKTKTGKKIVLLNPAEKGKRFARQMKNGCVSETGEKITKDGMAFRAGYLTARNDNAKAYKGRIKKGKAESMRRAKIVGSDW